MTAPDPSPPLPTADETAAIRNLLIRMGRNDEARAVHALAAALAAAVARAEQAEARANEYENCITWDTTCHNCARLLDQSYSDYMRRETAEARAERIENMAREMNAEAIKEWNRADAAEAEVARLRAERDEMGEKIIDVAHRMADWAEGDVKPTLTLIAKWIHDLRAIVAGEPILGRHGASPLPLVRPVSGDGDESPSVPTDHPPA